MTESKIKAYDDLPLFMNADHISRARGISKTTAYVLMTSDGFPSIRIGTRVLVERDKFKQWVDESSGN